MVLILDDTTKLRELLEAWEQAGVPGITILHSVGFQRAKGFLGRDDIPFTATLRDLLHAEEVHNRTLFSVIGDEETLERAIQAAGRVIGDFSAPNTGILFTIPLSTALGLRKKPAPGKPKAPEGPPVHIRKKPFRQLVSEVQERLSLKPTIVLETDPLEVIVRKVVKEPEIRTLCVVNEENVLVGLIPFHNLFEEVLFHVLPEEGLTGAVELKDVEALAGRLRARVARDYMSPPVWVKPYETMLEAFRRMKEAKVDGLPIVDEELHVIGYLSLMGLLQMWIE